MCRALGLTHFVLYSSTSNPNTQQLATRMATLGIIESFNPSTEDWNAYSERFDQYVIANDIKDEKKIVATFLTTIGSKTYNVLRDLLAPAKPSEVKLEVLVKTLRDHYEPKPIVIAERFHFHKREQHEGEGVAAYSAALKKCSEHCAFGTFLEEALRDRFVCGLRSNRHKRDFWQKKSSHGRQPWKSRWQWKLQISKPTISGFRLRLVA